jgi:hypothetical protein
MNFLEEGSGYNPKEEDHDRTNHNFIRQDSAHAIPWQIGLPRLPHNR